MSTEVANLQKKLLADWKKKDVNSVTNILAQIKGKLDSDSNISENMSKGALLSLLKDYYEIKAYQTASSLSEDMGNFKHAIAEVQSFYEIYPDKASEDNKNLMEGLYLMYLLASGQLPAFHTSIESIEESVRVGSPYISFAIELEQFFSESAYDKISLKGKNLPSPYYQPFIEKWMDTIRNEIASCVETSYKALSVKDATKLLLFDKESALQDFAKKNGWKNEKGIYKFDVDESMMEVDDLPKIDSNRLIEQMLYIAKHLERIV